MRCSSRATHKMFRATYRCHRDSISLTFVNTPSGGDGKLGDLTKGQGIREEND